jgi:ribonucleoside-triphosphate reductase
VAGFTPIPFYPFRFLVVLARYPIVKYILAVITSRGPRMYLLALAARAIRFPDYALVLIMVVLIAAANLPILSKFLKKKKASVEPSGSSPSG